MVCVSVIRSPPRFPCRIGDEGINLRLGGDRADRRSSATSAASTRCAGAQRIERQAWAVRAVFWNSGSLCSRASTAKIWSATALVMTGLTWAGTLMRTPAADAAGVAEIDAPAGSADPPGRAELRPRGQRTLPLISALALMFLMFTAPVCLAHLRRAGCQCVSDCADAARTASR